MQFEWDPRKSERNFISRGFDFEHATLVFFGTRVTYLDERRDYGESRWVTTGFADDTLLTVVFTYRVDETGSPLCRIISARRSNRKERRRYDEEAT